jgi:hypothetical protein
VVIDSWRRNWEKLTTCKYPVPQTVLN